MKWLRCRFDCNGDAVADRFYDPEPKDSGWWRFETREATMQPRDMQIGWHGAKIPMLAAILHWFRLQDSKTGHPDFDTTQGQGACT